MEEGSISYFRDLLARHIQELQDFCKAWEEVSAKDSIPEEVCDEIRTTIGLTNLLIREKLRQFEGLIDDCEHKRGDKEITCLDLQGFWDMVYHQVEKIQKSFKDLEMCQKNNWTFVREPVVKSEPKKVQKSTFPATAKTVVNSKAHIVAARQRLAEAKLKMKMQAAKKQDPFKVEIVSAGENHVNSKQNVEEIKASRKESDVKLNSDASGKQPAQTKNTLKKMKNIQIAEEKENSPATTLRADAKMAAVTPDILVNGGNKKQKGDGKASNKVNKENLSAKKRGMSSTKLDSAVPDEKPSISPPPYKKEKSKEFIPLQCITRSRKVMLEKQSA